MQWWQLEGSVHKNKRSADITIIEFSMISLKCSLWHRQWHAERCSFESVHSRLADCLANKYFLSVLTRTIVLLQQRHQSDKTREHSLVYTKSYLSPQVTPIPPTSLAMLGKLYWLFALFIRRYKNRILMNLWYIA